MAFAHSRQVKVESSVASSVPIIKKRISSAFGSPNVVSIPPGQDRRSA
ncbi:MAG: hypothetical protein LBR52_00505 [Prevotellaceae bacterium]|nr:hypothetical protein [Prevotellaceae bacterium]